MSEKGRSVVDSWQPAYVQLHKSGELKRRARRAHEMLAACNLCYRACGVNRLDGPPVPPTLGGAQERRRTLSQVGRARRVKRCTAPRQGEGRFRAFPPSSQPSPSQGEGVCPPIVPPASGGTGGRGVCRAGRDAVVASWTSHKWEEPPVSGVGGAGTIFFSQCTGRCIYCQNFSISQMGVGRLVTVERLAWMMLDLQERGCHNVEFVTPTHYIPPILAALDVAAERGLRIPTVWNTNGYDSVAALQLLDGVIDVYLPDAKYADDRVALRLSGFPHWTEANRACLLEMYRQMGDELVLDENGIARRGMIIRHLILPGNLSQTAAVLRWIAEKLSPNVHVSLMNQYFPTYKTVGHNVLGRKVTLEEYDAALDAFEAAGLNNGWGQEYDDSEYHTSEAGEPSEV